MKTPRTAARPARHGSLRLAALALIASLNTGSSCFEGLTKSVDRTADMTVAVLDDGIRTISNQSSSWRATLEDMQRQLTADAQSTVRNEISTLLTDSIGVANAGVFCTVDFIGHRVVQGLERIRAQLLGQPPPTGLIPAVCQVAPSAVEYAVWQQGRIPKIELYGYDLEAPLKLRLLEGTTWVDYSSRLIATTRYQRTVNLGSNGVPLTANSQRLELYVDVSSPTSSVAIIQPITPVCRRSQVTYRGPTTSFIPPRVGGDSEYSGHGPRVTATYSITASSNQISWSLYMDAKETQSDWTEVRGTRSGTWDFTPPVGKVIESVGGGTVSSVTYTDVDHEDDDQYPGTGPVNLFRFVGDTSGDDVGKTGVTVYLKDMTINLIESGNCVSPTAMQELIDKQLITPATQERLRLTIPPQ